MFTSYQAMAWYICSDPHIGTIIGHVGPLLHWYGVKNFGPASIYLGPESETMSAYANHPPLKMKSNEWSKIKCMWAMH